jgi:hypothetical protein
MPNKQFPDAEAKNAIFDRVADALDIPPSLHKKAVNRYNSVGKWLEGIAIQDLFKGSSDKPPQSITAEVYAQGSFALGTVVKPWVNNEEKDYDIDLVYNVKLDVGTKLPKSLKQAVGNRLKENENYKRMLREEGKRCWTLDYNESGSIEFHMDILPAFDEIKPFIVYEIDITHRNKDFGYEWLNSNPKRYIEWFKEKNKSAFDRISSYQRNKIFSACESLYASVKEVPDNLIKTPLQKTIQILKRHRDVMFSSLGKEDIKPISMIITTLSAYAYENESTTYEALVNIVEAFASYEGKSLDRGIIKRNLIARTQDGKWVIKNPVCPNENFADRWHEDNHKRSKAFFEWVKSLQRDILTIDSQHADNIKFMLENSFGSRVGQESISQIIAGAPTIIVHGMDADREIGTSSRPWGTDAE